MDKRSIAVVVVLLVVAVGLVGGGAFLVDRLGDGLRSSRQPEGRLSGGECDLLAPRGLAPSSWVDPDGGLVLTELEAGRIHLAYSMGSSFDPEDRQTAAVRDLLSSRLDRSRPLPLAPAERAALERLDRVVAASC